MLKCPAKSRSAYYSISYHTIGYYSSLILRREDRALAVFNEALQLKQVPLLSSLDSKQLKLLAFTCEVFDYADQDYLFLLGETSDCVYVILEGEVEIIGSDPRTGRRCCWPPQRPTT